MARHFLWDPIEDNVIAEFDDEGNLIVEYTTEPELHGDVISQRRDGETNCFYSDGLGSTTEVTNAAGDTIATRAYSAFGGTTESSGSLVFPFQYIGQKGYYFDALTNSYYIRRRVYIALIGRWNSWDPTHALGGSIEGYDDTNPFRYCLNNATNLSDPSGLYSLVEARLALCPISTWGTWNSLYCQSRLPLSTVFDYWYRVELASLGWQNSLIACPCTIKCETVRMFGPFCWSGQLTTVCSHSGRGEYSGCTQPSIPAARDYYHPGACMEIRCAGVWETMIAIGGETGQQCTYDSQGHLITFGPGAGTPDRTSPLAGIRFTMSSELLVRASSAAAHYIQDVEPFEAALILDNNNYNGPNVAKYLAVRPPNNANGCRANRGDGAGNVGSCIAAPVTPPLIPRRL